MFIAYAAALQAQPSPSTVPSPTEIVVVGQRIRDAEAQLKACLARHCATDEDVKASLDLAQQQIIAGKYTDARVTLIRSLQRNNSQAARYPIPVSDLWRARGDVDTHLGLDEDNFYSTWGIYRALKAGLPPENVRRLYARMEVAEATARHDGHLAAFDAYQSIADDARKLGYPDIAGMALLRAALNHLPPGEDRLAAIRRVAANTDPAAKHSALEAKLALARIAYENGDADTAERFEREFASMDLPRPLLIYTPSVETAQREISSSNEIGIHLATPSPDSKHGAANLPYAMWSSTNRIPDVYDKWLDVSFRVDPDGRVTDLRVVKNKGEMDWAEPLLAAIKLRRYTPGKPNDPSSLRLERYTYTAGWGAATGTHLASRSPQGRVEFFDLTDGDLFKSE